MRSWRDALTAEKCDELLARIPRLAIGVLGDLFLDRYLDIDATLTEPSLETGLDAYQVTRVRPSPGAAGTVVNNLVALGVGEVHVLSVIGDDGEGYELRQTLARQGVAAHLHTDPSRRTPTYTKPMLHEPGRPARELNRLDIKSRQLLPPEDEQAMLRTLSELWPKLDALLVLDQVSEPNCGVITTAVRERLTALADAEPAKMVLADSRERIGLFRSVWLKPNQRECALAVRDKKDTVEVEARRGELARRAGRPVFCTLGDKGILVADPRPGTVAETLVPAVPVSGPIDPVGAGDSTSAALACAMAAGATMVEAAAFANVVASITIQQLGTTGTASPEQIRAVIRALQATHF